MIIEEDLYLEHFGVKGMRWGIVNEEDRAELGKQFESFAHKQKYGSMNDPEEKIEDQGFFKGLSPAQKKAALVFGGAVVVAGLAYGAHRYNLNTAGTIDPRGFLDGRDAFDGISGAHKDGLLAYKDRRITLPAGSLVARVSKDIETNIRPGGFYAAHERHDIESYQGFLGSVGGHTNFFKATSEIRVPSTREYIDSLSRAMDHPDILKARGINTRTLDRLSPLDRSRVLTRLATTEVSRNDFPFSLNASQVDGLLPSRFVEDVRRSGFTSVIDYNNAGHSVAQTPLRHLDGTMFRFDSSEPITREVMARAKANTEANLDKISEFYDRVVHAGLMFLTGFFLSHNMKMSDLTEVST